MTDFTTLELAIDGPVARIWLNRPEMRNAIDDVFIRELGEAFALAEAAPEVRAVVLGGRGPAFCAGANLNWMKQAAEYTYEQNLLDAAGLPRMLRTLEQSRLPVIARIQGDVYAGGMGLVSVCDVAITVDTAHFCLSEVKIGLIPATISPYVLRAMGPRAAQRYFLTAERFGAADAHRIGFVHEVVSADALDAKVDEVVASLLLAAPNAVGQAKRLWRDMVGQPITEELNHETVVRIAALRASDEGREGLRAFLGKRKPGWIKPGA
ncbi:enoyl-CoA hydratase/isomerase family protein [Xenophilus arseniciresistens]|uniref:Enoyl-CoA hydratase/isomerase family protein n=1 Tax=Xenophilus arseniciresistens TaxID=1283306 RepID=A0AAE3N8W1_9BURK|nr:enoyl-CoA hydratase/isomerase family protein [Xenophilus arseniciresistens]MDA7416963.1 enoyl-CoA hydratase/isomerase family protein [Xenophilus arseniciresistens]